MILVLRTLSSAVVIVITSCQDVNKEIQSYLMKVDQTLVYSFSHHLALPKLMLNKVISTAANLRVGSDGLLPFSSSLKSFQTSVTPNPMSIS